MNEKNSSPLEQPTLRKSAFAVCSVAFGSLSVALPVLAWVLCVVGLSRNPLLVGSVLTGAVRLCLAMAVVAVVCGLIASLRIKNSVGTLGGAGLALSGCIIGVFVILLAGIVAPIWVNARDTANPNLILHNLRMIEGAKDQWALEHTKLVGDTPTAAELAPYLKGGTVTPVVDETYVINPIGTLPYAVAPVRFRSIPAGGKITAP